MKNKLFILGLILSILIVAVPQRTVFADGDSIKFDEEKSVVRVKYDADDYTNYKVQVKKDDKKYNYNIFDNDEVFPLQMGSGNYKVTVYKRKSGNRYTSVMTESANLDLKENQVYLQSVQVIDWNDKCKAIKLAKELSLDKTQDEERFREIYAQIIETIKYDDYATMNKKARNTRYLPVLDTTIDKKRGICYDYSSLMAGMLRSLGIPTKMQHGIFKDKDGNMVTGGDGKPLKHAWNEVLLNGKWIVIDSTNEAVDYKVDRSKIDYKQDKKRFIPQKEF